MESKDESSQCSSCQPAVRLSEEQIALLLNGYFSTHPDDQIGDKACRQRLEACLECPDLEFGNTCRHCGCLVDLRTKILSKTCPHPTGSKWCDSLDDEPPPNQPYLF